MSMSARRKQNSSIPSGLHFRRDDMMVFSDRRFWVHLIFNGLPAYSDEIITDENGQSRVRRFYGDQYPLELVEGDWRTPLRDNEIEIMRDAGITGVQVLLFGQPSMDKILELTPLADATHNDSDPTNRVLIAPCIQVDTADIVAVMQEYATYAAGHPSIAKIDGKFVVYTFNSTTKTESEWRNIRNQLEALDIPVYLIMDYQLDASQYGNTINQANEARATALFPVNDANYIFDDSLHLFFPRFVEFVNKYRRPFAGGMLPGYNRETEHSPGQFGGYRDSRGTKVYRQLLSDYQKSELMWQNIISWSDIAENHEIRPTSNWHKTRSDITAFYSALHRNRPFPRPEPELYITTPKAIFVGEAIEAEAMILNGGGQPVSAQVQIVDGAGNDVLGPITSSPIIGGTSGDATVPYEVNSVWGGHWMRAKARILDASGNIIKEVLSAPICIYPAGATPTAPIRRSYYSIPAYAALPDNVSLSLSASPVSSPDTSEATVTTSSGRSMRFIEVIQNTRQVWLKFDSTSYTTGTTLNSDGSIADPLPMSVRHVTNANHSAAPNGFYVGRVIDDEERVGYSDPLYFA